MSVTQGAAPDGDRPTTHLRCGSDIRGTLRQAGFAGTFLEYADPLCQGPVLDGPGWRDARRRFVAGYGLPGTADRLHAEQAALDRAIASGDRLVLWFEHDPYDQLILAYLLQALEGRPGVELICIDRHPGSQRFLGLGQLTPGELGALWPGRVPVSAGQGALGRQVWAALRQATPLPLWEIARRPTPDLPPMAPALVRLLQELPGRGDGLSLTERLSLQAVAAGAATIGRVFGDLQRSDPLPFLGDLMLVPILGGLAATDTPALEIGAAAAGAERPVRLTGMGKRLLAGEADWQDAGPGERWVGGVRIGGATPGWRWPLDPPG